MKIKRIKGNLYFKTFFLHCLFIELIQKQFLTHLDYRCDDTNILTAPLQYNLIFPSGVLTTTDILLRSLENKPKQYLNT